MVIILSGILLVLISVCQKQGNSSYQVGYDLKQFGKLHLWVKLKQFSFLSAWSLQKLDTCILSSLNR